MKKLLIISSCTQCPFFDNEYHSYRLQCKILNVEIEEGDDENYPIPSNCPLLTATPEDIDRSTQPESFDEYGDYTSNCQQLGNVYTFSFGFKSDYWVGQTSSQKRGYIVGFYLRNIDDMENIIVVTADRKYFIYKFGYDIELEKVDNLTITEVNKILTSVIDKIQGDKVLFNCFTVPEISRDEVLP